MPTITRIVRLTIDHVKVTDFEAVFLANKLDIEAFEGCLSVEVYIDVAMSNCYVTYSKWTTLEALENYRESVLFRGIWAQVKPMFIAKPTAWSLSQI